MKLKNKSKLFFVGITSLFIFHSSFSIELKEISSRAKQVTKTIGACIRKAPGSCAHYAYGIMFEMMPHELRNDSKAVRITKTIAFFPMVVASAIIGSAVTSGKYICKSMITNSEEWQADANNRMWEC